MESFNNSQQSEGCPYLKEICLEDIYNPNDLEMIQLTPTRVDPGSFPDPWLMNSEDTVTLLLPEVEKPCIKANKPQVNLEPIPDMGFNFEISLNGGEQCSKKNWTYSSKLQKLFIKLHKTVNVKFILKKPAENVFVRTMLVFTDVGETHKSVDKCLHHGGVTKVDDSNDRKDHIICSDIPEAQYVGYSKGVDYYDRYAVLVKLNDRFSGENNGKVTVSVPFKFTCLSSCASGINRRATTIVFTLEDQQCNIVGKTCINLKVCSGPNRDKDKEEAELSGVAKSSGKRKMNKSDSVHLEAPPGKRVSICTANIKKEPEESQDEQETQQGVLVEAKVELKLPAKIMEHTLTCAYNALAAAMREKDAPDLSHYMKGIVSLMKGLRRE